MRFSKKKFHGDIINHALPEREAHPLDVVEFVAELQEREFHRPSEDEIYFVSHDRQSFYEESLQWYDKIETLAYTCGFEMQISEERQLDVIDLVSRLNSHLLTGHFDYIIDHHQITFRYGLMLQGGVNLSGKQCETLLQMGPKLCSRYFSTFTLVAESQLDPQTAIRVSLLETVGQA